mmetsp:Transcript_116759/g.341841  ORF Transcript_116759/g.341841 Transcript_116759/m.341841 type:complete len:186 (+) Transcript_116759:56-613(+)
MDAVPTGATSPEVAHLMDTTRALPLSSASDDTPAQLEVGVKAQSVERVEPVPMVCSSQVRVQESPEHSMEELDASGIREDADALPDDPVANAAMFDAICPSCSEDLQVPENRLQPEPFEVPARADDGGKDLDNAPRQSSREDGQPVLGTWSGAFRGVLHKGSRRGGPLQAIVGQMRCAILGCQCD